MAATAVPTKASRTSQYITWRVATAVPAAHVVPASTPPVGQQQLILPAMRDQPIHHVESRIGCPFLLIWVGTDTTWRAEKSSLLLRGASQSITWRATLTVPTSSYGPARTPRGDLQMSTYSCGPVRTPWA